MKADRYEEEREAARQLIEEMRAHENPDFWRKFSGGSSGSVIFDVIEDWLNEKWLYDRKARKARERRQLFAQSIDVEFADITFLEQSLPPGLALSLRNKRIWREVKTANQSVARAKELGFPNPEQVWQREGSWILLQQKLATAERDPSPYDYTNVESNLPFSIGTRWRERRIGLWNYRLYEIVLPFGGALGRRRIRKSEQRKAPT